jgi:dTDP-4-dehydrorhamnose reductase
LWPHHLARTAAALDAQVIQIATDCVYSGSDGDRTESDMHDATDVYGKTKSLGESYGDHVHHLRCSIIGPEKVNNLSLMGWFLSAEKGAKLKGYVNHFWNGITTLQFAKICLGIVKNNINLGHIQHIVPADIVSKSVLLRCLSEVYRPDVEIQSKHVGPNVDRTLSTEYPLDNIELWKAAGYDNPPTIPEMIRELSRY